MEGALMATPVHGINLVSVVCTAPETCFAWKLTHSRLQSDSFTMLSVCLLIYAPNR